MDKLRKIALEEIVNFDKLDKKDSEQEIYTENIFEDNLKNEIDKLMKFYVYARSKALTPYRLISKPHNS